MQGLGVVAVLVLAGVRGAGYYGWQAIEALEEEVAALEEDVAHLTGDLALMEGRTLVLERDHSGLRDGVVAVAAMAQRATADIADIKGIGWASFSSRNLAALDSDLARAESCLDSIAAFFDGFNMLLTC